MNTEPTSILTEPIYLHAAARLMQQVHGDVRRMAERAACRRQELGPFPSKDAMRRHVDRTLSDVAVMLAQIDPTAARQLFEACTPDEPRQHSISPSLAARRDQERLYGHNANTKDWLTDEERRVLERSFAPTLIQSH